MTFQQFVLEIGRRLPLDMVVSEMPYARVQIDLQDDPQCIYTCDLTMQALIKAELDLAMRAKELNVVTSH